MDCAKTVKTYARNGKQGVGGCGKKGFDRKTPDPVPIAGSGQDGM